MVQFCLDKVNRKNRRYGESMSRRRVYLCRYSKRPLRGPYGQMLEAEMAKPRATDIALEEGLRPRRKVSANLSYNTSSNNSGSEPPTPCHHRTTSSPSKLEGLPGPSPELLAELLRGSSERVARAPVHRNVSTIKLNIVLARRYSRVEIQSTSGIPHKWRGELLQDFCIVFLMEY